MRDPGDGRIRPQIPAVTLLWAQIIGCILRECNHHAVERLVCSPARGALGVARSFGDDSLAYLSERLEPDHLRDAMVSMLREAKRRKAFSDEALIGLALDGTGSGRCSSKKCPLCHPVRNKEGKVTGYLHHFSMISVTGTGISLPFDIEPYGPGDSERAASIRLLHRAVHTLGPRFADYVVMDADYATAPTLNAVGEHGLYSIVRLKRNLPDLYSAAKRRFSNTPPHCTFHIGRDFVEMWDADDFDPWGDLRWGTVRVFRYRQRKPNGQTVEAYWLTDMPKAIITAKRLFSLAKSRWEIENQGFNDCKNRYGMEHIAHHHENSLLVHWLITLLAIMIERLYRCRFLKRGTHPVMSPIQLLTLLRTALAPRARHKPD